MCVYIYILFFTFVIFNFLNYLYIYLSIYVYIFVCIYIYVCIYMRVYMYVCVCVCVYIYISVFALPLMYLLLGKHPADTLQGVLLIFLERHCGERGGMKVTDCSSRRLLVPTVKITSHPTGMCHHFFFICCTNRFVFVLLHVEMQLANHAEFH